MGNTAIRIFLEKGSVATTENDGVFFPFTGGITMCSLQYYNFDFEKGIFKMAGVPSMYLVNQEILQKPFCLVLPY